MMSVATRTFVARGLRSATVAPLLVLGIIAAISGLTTPLRAVLALIQHRLGRHRIAVTG